MSNELSEKNLILHEFIGLQTSIVDSPCKNLISRSGIIIDETMNTFKIEQFTQNNNVKKIITVPKHTTRFQFILPSNQNNFKSRSNSVIVELDGSIITKRPEDRIKKLVKLANKMIKRTK